MRSPFCILSIITILAIAYCSEVGANPGTPDVSIHDSYQFKVKKKGDKYPIEYKREFRLTYLSQRATQSNVLRFSEGLNAEIKDIKASCRNQRIDKEEINVEVPMQEDQLFLERKIYAVTYPSDLAQNEQVSYSYQVKFKDISYLPMYSVPNPDRLENFELLFEHPSDLQVDFAIFFPHLKIPFEVVRPDSTHTIFRVGPLVGQESLPYTSEVGQQALVLPIIKQGDKWINPTLPADFADWYQSLFDFAVELPVDFELPIQVALDEAPNDLARLGLIYDYVRMNYRYISDISDGHSLVPLPPNEIADNKYGDCKDRVCLMKAIAAREGIAIDFVLVGSTPGVSFDNRANYSQFNHVIGAYGTPGDTFFFDPTAKYAPFGQLPERDVGQTALVLRGAESYLTEVPPTDGLGDDKPALEMSILAKSDNLKSGIAEIVLRRWYREGVAVGVATKRGVELQNFLKILVGKGFYKLGLHDFEVIEADANPVILRARADLSDFAVISPTRIYLPQFPFISVGTEIRERADDEMPLYFEQRDDFAMHITLLAPGYESQPAEFEVGNSGVAWFSASLAQVDSSQVDFSYFLRRPEKILLGADRDQYLEFATEILEHKKDMFILKKVEP